MKEEELSTYTCATGTVTFHGKPDMERFRRGAERFIIETERKKAYAKESGNAHAEPASDACA